MRTYNCVWEERYEKMKELYDWSRDLINREKALRVSLEDEVEVLADENAKLRLQVCQLQSMLECEGLM